MFHVIDDTDAVREVVTTTLKQQGYETMSFACPKEYISFVNCPDFRNPTAVFVDVTMPAMTGYEMMNIVSELKLGLKFVVMTGEPEIRSEYATKACMYLGKPFRVPTLIEVIDSLIQCDAYGSADVHRCTDIDNREKFSIENWSCPHECD